MTDQERFPDPAVIRHAIGVDGTLSLSNVSGEVDLRATDGDEVVVTARSEHGSAESLPLIVRRTEGGLHVEVEKAALDDPGSWLRKRGGIEFDVEVPRRARVDVNTVSSNVGARFLAGEQSYRTVSGDVEVDPDGGRIAVTTVSGDVEVRAVEPCELRVATTSGDVQVEGDVLSSFDARTVSGDIEFEAGLAPGPVHTVETVSGDLSIESTTGVTVEVKRSMDFARGGASSLVAGDGAAHLRFRTLSGDCHVAGARRTERVARDDRRDRSFVSQLERHGERLARHFAGTPESPPAPPASPMPPMPPMAPMAPSAPAPVPDPALDAAEALEVLRALERGEIDVDEAQRRLQEAPHG
jgi:hypothetical protein